MCLFIDVGMIKVNLSLNVVFPVAHLKRATHKFIIFIYYLNKITFLYIHLYYLNNKC